jgi:hypothetical protein
MASQGPLSPGTAGDDSTVGTVNWSNPGNITTSNDSYATAAGGGITFYLTATNFGFTIPTGATINGIAVEIERSRLGGLTTTDEHVQLIKAGVVGGEDKADTVTVWGTTDAVITYGGAADLWTDTWTAAQINAIDFGAAISADVGVAVTARVDHIRITIHYTDGTGTYFRQVRRHTSAALHSPPIVVVLHSRPNRRHQSPAGALDVGPIAFPKHRVAELPTRPGPWFAGQLTRRRVPQVGDTGNTTIAAASKRSLVPKGRAPFVRGAASRKSRGRLRLEGPPVMPGAYRGREAHAPPRSPLPPLVPAPRSTRSRRGKPGLGGDPVVSPPGDGSGSGDGRRGSLTAIRSTPAIFWKPAAATGRRRRGRVPNTGTIMGPMSARHRLFRISRQQPPGLLAGSPHGRRRHAQHTGAYMVCPPGADAWGDSWGDSWGDTWGSVGSGPCVPAIVLWMPRRRLRVRLGLPPDCQRRGRARTRVLRTGLQTPGPATRRRPTLNVQRSTFNVQRSRRGRVYHEFATPVPLRRTALQRLAVPFVQGQRRTRKRTALTVVAVPRRRRALNVERRTLNAQRSTRRRSYRTGEFLEANATRSRARLRLWPFAAAISLRAPRKRHRRVLRDPFVPGPYYVVTGQIYVAGAVAGDIQVE